MTQIILKTTKRPNLKASPIQPAAVQPALNAAPQAVVIDFSKNHPKQLTAKTLLIIFACMASFFMASLFALFILGQQLNNLWREAANTTQPQSRVKIHSNTKYRSEPETAFPATKLIPLPSKALILGKDFQQTKSAAANAGVDLVPILERLPLNEKAVRAAPRPSLPASSFVEVETIPGASLSASLQDQADNAVAAGNTDKAIQLYLRAVKANPKDDNLRSNCVALLLEQARSYDETGDIPNALSAYKKAQTLWQGNAQTLAGINARITFLEQQN